MVGTCLHVPICSGAPATDSRVANKSFWAYVGKEKLSTIMMANLLYFTLLKGMLKLFMKEKGRTIVKNVEKVLPEKTTSILMLQMLVKI